MNAGNVAPSAKRYQITDSHEHKTLHVGDIVVMAEDPNYNNLLIRESDMTLHKLQSADDQYVHLAEVN